MNLCLHYIRQISKRNGIPIYTLTRKNFPPIKALYENALRGDKIQSKYGGSDSTEFSAVFSFLFKSLLKLFMEGNGQSMAKWLANLYGFSWEEMQVVTLPDDWGGASEKLQSFLSAYSLREA